MATIDTLQEPRLGEPGEACAECGSPLAADQRYCLECGTRRGDPRLEYAKYLNNGANGADGPPSGPAGSGSKQPGSGRDWTPFVLVGLVAGLGMMLAIGVLIGKGGSGSDQATPQVVQVGRHRHRHGLRQQPADRRHPVQERLAVGQGGLHGRDRHPRQAGDDGRAGGRREVGRQRQGRARRRGARLR